MIDIGRLRVRLGLNNADFRRGIRESNRDLAAFGKAIGILAAGVVTTATGALAAMGAQSLRTVDTQAKLAQSLNTTTASIQVMTRAGDLAGVNLSGVEQATKDLTRRLSQAADGGGPAADVLDRLGLSAGALIAMPLDQRIATINDAIEEFVPLAGRAAVAGQLFGEEGAIAMQRIDSDKIRTAARDVERFGVAVSEVDAEQIQRTNDAISRLSLISTGLGNQVAVAVAPALERMADFMAEISEVGGPLNVAITTFMGNLDRLAAIAGVAATAFGVKLVASFVAARVATLTWAGALHVLRGALIRTGIGALVVLGGELVLQFGRLVSAAGGFGNAFGLIKDVGVEVFDRLKLAFVAFGFRFASDMMNLRARGIEAFDGMGQAAHDFGNLIAGVAIGARDGFRAIFGQLPEILGEIMFGAVNRIIEAIEGMFTKIRSGVDRLSQAINDVFGSEITLLGEADLGRVKNPYAGAGAAAGGAFKDAFNNAVGQDYIGPRNTGAADAAAELRRGAELSDDMADIFGEGVKAPLESIEAMREAMKGAAVETDVLTSEVEETVVELDDLASGSTAAAGALKDAQEPADDLAKALNTGLSSAIDQVAGAWADFLGRGFKDFKSFASSIKDAFLSLLRDMVVQAARNKILISLGLGGGGAAGGIVSGLGGIGGIGSAIAGAGGIAGLGTAFLGGASFLGSGIAGGFAAGGIGGAISGGAAALGTAVSGATLGLGGAAAALGAAVPVIGAIAIGAKLLGGLFGKKKKKPIISSADFKSINASLDLVGMNFDGAGDKISVFGKMLGTTGSLIKGFSGTISSAFGKLFSKNNEKRYAAHLKKLAGGADKFQELTAGYFQKFFTQEEQREKAVEGLEDQFDDLGLDMPKTAKEFRALVEQQDLSTKKGRENYVQLLRLSDTFAAVFGDLASGSGINASNLGDVFSTRAQQQLTQAALARGATVSQLQSLGGVITPGELITLTEEGADGSTQTRNIADLLRIVERWDILGVPASQSEGTT